MPASAEEKYTLFLFFRFPARTAATSAKRRVTKTPLRQRVRPWDCFPLSFPKHRRACGYLVILSLPSFSRAFTRARDFNKLPRAATTVNQSGRICRRDSFENFYSYRACLYKTQNSRVASQVTQAWRISGRHRNSSNVSEVIDEFLRPARSGNQSNKILWHSIFPRSKQNARYVSRLGGRKILAFLRLVTRVLRFM